MIYKNLKKIVVLLIFIFCLGIYLLFSKSDFASSIKSIFPQFVKDSLKNTIFFIPYQIRDFQNTSIQVKEMEIKIRNLNNKIEVLNSKIRSGLTKEEIILDKNSNKFFLKKIFLDYSLDGKKDKTEKKPGYLELYKNQVLVIFWSGKIIYTAKKNLKNTKVDFFEIESDIGRYLKDDKDKFISIKDALILNDKLYLSYTKNINPDTNCLNLSVIRADIFENSDRLNLQPFEEFFTYEECLEARFNGYQSGGRLENYKDEKILLTIGDFQNFIPAQNLNSLFGKIISIDKETKNYKILSMGHRNQQGLLYDEKLDIILSTEHGQKGGDEVNLILDNKDEISNYGWPIASYSDYYGYETNSIKKIAPFKKSHEENGFIEPLIYFTPALGISQIIKNSFKDNQSELSYIITSMAKRKIVFLELNKNFNSANVQNEIYIGERIRDIIKQDEGNYLLYLEDSPAIGVIRKN